mgnify:CR=1 FL=1
MTTARQATTVIYDALARFERASGMPPRVVLLPRRVFDQYSRERVLLDSVLPDAAPPKPKDPREWSDVRVVENERSEEIEVY